MTRKYPLDAVQAVREARSETAAVRLAEEQRRADAARRELAGVEAELERARERLVRAGELERARLEQGLERAFDLARAAEARRAELERLSELDRRRASAGTELERAARASAAAVLALEQARAELRAAQQHREAWRKGEERASEGREEEASLERWNAERSRASGR